MAGDRGGRLLADDRGKVVAIVERVAITDDYRILARAERRRPVGRVPRAERGVVHQFGVRRADKLDLVGDRPVARIVRPPGKHDLPAAVEVVGAQRDPAEFVHVVGALVVFLRLLVSQDIGRLKTAVCDRVLRLAVQVALVALAVEKVPSGEDLVTVQSGRKGGRGPRGRGAGLQRPRLGAGAVRIAPSKRESDAAADIEVAQRVSGRIRLVVDLDELEVVVVDEARGDLLGRGVGRVVHDLVDHEVLEVRGTVTQSEEGGAQQREVRAAGALGVQADRDAVRRAAEVDVLAIPARHAGGIRRKVHVITEFAQQEPGTEVIVLVENKVSSRRDCRKRGDLVLGEHLDAEFVGLPVAKPPSAHVDGRTALVAKFDRIHQRRVGVGEHLVDDDRTWSHEGIFAARRTARCGAGAPAVLFAPEVQGAFRIADSQRKTVAVGVVVPAVLVAELLDTSGDGRVEFDLLTGVGQQRTDDEPRSVLTGDLAAITAVTKLEGRPVAHHDDVLVRGDGYLSEGEVDPVVESQTGKRQRPVRDVRDLDELEVVGVLEARGKLGRCRLGGAIHNLGDADVGGNVDVVSGLVQRAPDATVVDSRLDVPALVEGDRAGIDGSPRTRVGAVECVVDRARRRVDSQRIGQVDHPAVLIRTVDVERRRYDIGVESHSLDLVEVGLGPLRKIIGAERVDSRGPV